MTIRSQDAMRIFLQALLLVMLTGGMQAQEPAITPDTPVSTTMLDEWLHSGDPRLIAWAADFARRNHDAAIVAELPALLDEALLPASSDFGNQEAQAARRGAMLAVLDTLVQENFPTPIHTIETIAASFPAQAALLIAAHPFSESRNTLQQWFLGSTGDAATGRELARIAAMMLAKDAKANTTSSGRSESVDPGLPGFVASVVAASENQLEVTVTEKNGIGRGIGSGCCGDSLGRTPKPGWPEVYFYDLEEHSSDLEKGNPDASTPVVVELGDDRIVARRWKEGSGWGSCYGLEPLDAATRHRLIAYWLGVHDREMSWHAIDNFTIVWTNVADYNRRLGEIVEAQRRKLRDTAEQLRQLGLLTDPEASQLTPKLVLKIHCEIEPCPI